MLKADIKNLAKLQSPRLLERVNGACTTAINPCKFPSPRNHTEYNGIKTPEPIANISLAREIFEIYKGAFSN